MLFLLKNTTKNMESKILWFTGLSGAGKTTIANGLKKFLDKAIILDGDELRRGLCSDLGFSIEDRNENVRRVRELAKFLHGQGFTIIVTLISPIREERDKARELFPEGTFTEIYLSTPIEICEKRDVKGLYKKLGVKMTGKGSPYEPPINPELSCNTDMFTVEQIVKKIYMHYLEL